MNKKLKENFEDVTIAWEQLTVNVSDYGKGKDLQDYYDKLTNFQGEVDYEVEVISRDLVKHK